MNIFPRAGIHRRYLLSFFSIVIVTDVVISILLFSFYRYFQINKAKEFFASQLEQVCTSTDIFYESLISVVNQILSDNDSQSVLISSDMNISAEANSSRKLREIVSSSPYFKYITLYNNSLGRAVSDSYRGLMPKKWNNLFFNKLESRRPSIFVRQAGNNHSLEHSADSTVYTFVFPVNMKSDKSADLIIIDIYESYFNRIISNLRMNSESQEVILLNAQGGVIAFMTSEKGTADFSISDPSYDYGTINSYSQRIFSQDLSSGSLVDRKSNTWKFITFIKSELTGIVIVNALPYNSILAGILPIALLTIFLSFLTLAIGYLISQHLSLYLYAPIKTIYERYVSSTLSFKKANELELLSDAILQIQTKADTLEQGLIAAYNDSKNLYLRQLLYGEEAKIQMSRSAFERTKINLESPYYCVLVLECSGRHDASASSDISHDPFVTHYALENTVREILSPIYTMDFVRTDENIFVTLLYLTEDHLVENFKELVDPITEMMAKKFFSDVTICIGQVVATRHNINLCYEQARITLMSRPISRTGHVFFETERGEEISIDQYFNNLHRRISNYVGKGDLEGCCNEFDLAIVNMENISFKTATAYFKHVMMSVLDEFSSFFRQDGDTFLSIMSKINKVESSHNIMSLKSTTICFLKELIYQLDLFKRNPNPPSAFQAKEYIDSNYANPNLSMRMLSDILHLSPAYLGKIFATSTNMSFNNYLAHVRMNKAAELLTGSKLSVEEISRNVGIENTNYFYSLFKKRYGMTPAAYRKLHL